jgi:hypothetical protein
MILKQTCIWLVFIQFYIDDARNHKREDRILYTTTFEAVVTNKDRGKQGNSQ